ncbi:MAG: ribonuclease P protein component [Candidatus Komeilibacteria bacterium]
MLPADNRLKRDQDFQKVAAKGRYGYSALLTVKYCPNHLPVSRFGFVISTKVDKRAVVRNRIKRRVREIIRLKLDEIKLGFDIVIIMKKASVEAKYADFSQDLFLVLERANLLC